MHNGRMTILKEDNNSLANRISREEEKILFSKEDHRIRDMETAMAEVAAGTIKKIFYWRIKALVGAFIFAAGIDLFLS